MSGGAVDKAWAALATVKDPCLVAAGFDLSIVDLGLVRDVTTSDAGVALSMTFTEPGCPFTHHVVVAVENALQQAGFADVALTPVWDPLWTESELSPEAQRQFATARDCMRARGGQTAAARLG